MSADPRCPECDGAVFRVWYDVPTFVDVDLATESVNSVLVSPACGAPRIERMAVTCENEEADCEWETREGEVFDAVVAIGDNRPWPEIAKVD